MQHIHIHHHNHKAEPTYMFLVLDRSGSMHNIIDDMVGSANAIIDAQRKHGGEVYVTVGTFSDKLTLLHVGAHISGTWNILPQSAYGSTALYDAVNETVHAVPFHRRGIVHILTDGGENSSRFTTREDVKRLISAREESGWEFHFVGAGIDAWAGASQIGIRQAHTTDVPRSADGMRAFASASTEATLKYRGIK